MILKSINPHNQTIVGKLKVSSSKEVSDAISKSKRAYASWRKTSLQERLTYISKYKNLLIKNRNKIAELVTLEMGKPIKQSLDDVDSEIVFLDYYIDNAHENLADEFVLRNKKESCKVVHEPYGVCAVIAPWNFPLSMANSGIVPALIAGNTVVFKPSEYSTLSQKMATDLLNMTGLPGGVLTTLTGAGDVGAILVEEDIDLVWFTGSTRVGREIFEKSGKKFIKSLLEMGGSSPAVIFSDADLENAIENIYWGRFLNCGQVCTSVKRLFVEKPIFSKVAEMLKNRLAKVKVDDPFNKDTDIGPLVNKKQLEKIELQVSNAVSKGANILIGGKKPTERYLLKGNYYEPTILTNVNFDMKVMKEETFGPVLPIMPFSNEKQAIEYANNTEYGLSAEVYTSDMDRAERVAREIQAGVVAINTDNFFKPECPFGGCKLSGMGREYGRIGMQEFCQIKSVYVYK